MNQAWQKQAQSVLSLDYAEVCFAAFLNFLLMAIILIGRNNIFYGASVPICLAMTITLLLTILIERLSSHTGTSQEMKDILKAVFFEVFLLFSISLLPPTANVLFLLLETLFVFAVQSGATLFFGKAFRIELAEFFIFVALTIELLPEEILRSLVYIEPKIKMLQSRLGRIHVPHLLGVKKAKVTENIAGT